MWGVRAGPVCAGFSPGRAGRKLGFWFVLRVPRGRSAEAPIWTPGLRWLTWLSPGVCTVSSETSAPAFDLAQWRLSLSNLGEGAQQRPRLRRIRNFSGFPPIFLSCFLETLLFPGWGISQCLDGPQPSLPTAHPPAVLVSLHSALSVSRKFAETSACGWPLSCRFMPF